jgi:glycosyltransferase involved in cell wall biosynthesis
MVSVIITAYKSHKWIKRCLDSVAGQGGAECEILLGIDGCSETLKEVEKIQNKYPGLKVFMAKKNGGTYPLRNALAAKAKGQYLLFFDSDDEMLPNMISKCLFMRADYVSYWFSDYVNNKPVRTRHIEPAGTFLISSDFFKKSGGFLPWQCAADSEFHYRMKKNGYNATSIYEVLFIRHIIEDSLSNSKLTGMNSKIRQDYKSYFHTNKNWSIPINTKKTKLFITFTHEKEYFFNDKHINMAEFKFKKEYENIKVTITIGGTPVNITADNLTDSVARHLLTTQYAHLIEPTKGQKKSESWTKKEGGVKPTSQERTTSTLQKAKAETKPLEKSSQKSVSKQSALKPKKQTRRKKK